MCINRVNVWVTSEHFAAIKVQLFIHFVSFQQERPADACRQMYTVTLKPSSVPKTLWQVIVAKLTSFNVGTWNPLSCYYMLLGFNVSVEDNVKADINEIKRKAYTWFVCLRIRTRGGLLRVRQWIWGGEGFTQCGEFWLRTRNWFTMRTAPWSQLWYCD